METSLNELIDAARVMNAPPAAVNNEQRRQAEQLLIKFKRSDKPYSLCRYIFENSEDAYLHFVSCSTLKEGLMREWSTLSIAEIDDMRDYLLNYTNTHKHLSGFVLRQMLHVVALIVKRCTLTRSQAFLDEFVNNVCALFTSPDTLGLGLEICSGLIVEFTVADKTLSPYMSYQHNLDCKRAIEGEPLYKIFMSTLETVTQFRTLPIADNKIQWMRIMSILHSILSWDFGIILSKRLAQMSNLTLPIVNLRPSMRWQILKQDDVLNLVAELYAVFEVERDIQHYARLCLVQLGTLQGSIFDDATDRINFLSRYLRIITKLISRACEQKTKDEHHGLSLAIRQLLWTYTSQELNNINSELWSQFLEALTQLTLQVLLHSVNDDELSDTGSTQDIVDVVLDIWFTLVGQAEDLQNATLDSGMSRVVECYVHCHVAPPLGLRNDARDLEEIDAEAEEDDREKYRDQLHIVGCLARRNLDHTLPLYSSLLLQRIAAIRERTENQEESTPLYEDLHWLVLLIGYTIADGWTDGSVQIPSSITEYLYTKPDNLNIDSLYSHIRNKIGQCVPCPVQNKVLASIFYLLELGAVYQDLLSKGACHYLSPQVYSSFMWVLARVTASYHMPQEHKYTYIPKSLVLALGEESQVGQWLVGFLVEKIISGLVFFSGEKSVAEDCLLLVQSLSKNAKISMLLMKDENFVKLVERFTSGSLVLPSSKCNRVLAAAMITVMSHLPLNEHQPFLDKVFGKIRDSTVRVLNSSDVESVAVSPRLTSQIITSLDTFNGVATGLVTKVVDLVFPMVLPVLEGCVNLIRVSQHISPITRSVLELFCCVSDSVILHIDKQQTHRLYEVCYQLLKSYSNNASKVSLTAGVEDDRYDSMLLCLELLSHLCSKDFLNFDAPDEYDDSTSKIVLIGLDILVPHIDIELLKFPKLSYEFFKLITFICEVYPEKVGTLPDPVVDQIMMMLKVGLNNYNDDITFYIFNALSALSVYSVTNAVFQKKLGQLVKHTMMLISTQELSAELYDPASDMVFSFICKCREEYISVVNEIVSEQADAHSRDCLRTAFSSLIPNTLNLTRKDKAQFSKVFENFAINVYGICR